MIFRICNGVVVYLLLLASTSVAFDEPQQENLTPLTVAEASHFKSTSSSQEVIEFLEEVATVDHISTFEFGRTVENRPMTGIAMSKQPYQLGNSDDRLVILVLGNIHSGECAGKEALLMMARELRDEAEHRWLKKAVVLFVPNYNADANDRVGKGNRPGQIGPENGMGRRENAQNLDLNRDFIKLESPEARALVQLIDKTNPHLFIDCHTTNGSKHRYALTYDIPHNPSTAEPIRSFLRHKMMPEVTKRLEKSGTDTFYYGNFSDDHTRWTTFGHEPRYSTEYVGLRGRLAILSEAYSYIPYKDRVFATKDFVSACLDYVTENSNSIQMLLNSVDQDLARLASTQPSRISMSLDARVEKFNEKFVLKGYKHEQPFDYECDFIGKYVPTVTTPLPFAYVIPGNLIRPVDRLLMHGIEVGRLTTSIDCDVNVDTVKSMNRNERVFQKHKMLRAESQQETNKRQIPKGSFIVRTAQPLGRLAAYLLECQSNDGLVFWNFLDEFLNEGSEYPILRIENPLELSIDKINQINQLGSLTLDMIGGTFSILDSVPTPKWLEGNQIEMSLYGRSFAMDAESVSFVAPRPQNYQSSQIAEQLVELGVDQEQANELSRIKPIESENRHWLVFDGDQSDFIYDVRNKKVRLIGTLESSAELFTFSPNQEQLAFVKEDVLSWIDVENNQRYRLSVEQQTDQLFGKLDWVYQEELYGRGNFKGYWFSPDSKYLAFLMLDETDVGKFTISDHIPVRGKDEFLSYPKAGDSNPTVKLGLVSTSNPNRVNWINLGSYAEQEILIANVSWRPDSSQLVFQLQNREQTFLDLLAVEPDKSQPTLLFRDETPAWIDSPGEPKWLSNGSFVWLSPRNGYKHLYHCNPDGSVKRQLTSGPWEVREVAEFDPANGLIYFISAKDEPTELHAYRLDVVSGEIIKITSEPGTHRVAFNASKTMLIDSFSTATQPTSHQLKKSNGEFLRVLNASSDDRIQYVGLQEPKYFEIESSNDQPLDAMLIYPPDFDPNQKYPVLIHTYAGPQAPQVRNRFGGSWALWHQCLAQQGYVVFKCDNQSASYRSVKNAWPIHRDLGRRELADIELGVAWLKKQSWVDSARIGIWGWSYGGYMTAYALTHSESFKIGISGAPVTDWRNYDTIYTERYMGLPQTNQIGYEASSVVKAAGQLRGKLLLIHGSIDDNVHLSNSMQFAMELQQAGKQFELMIYPKNRHGIRRPEQAKHLRRLMFEFVLENL